MGFLLGPTLANLACFRYMIEENIAFSKLKDAFTCRLGNLFRFKDSLEKKILSGIVYR